MESLLAIKAFFRMEEYFDEFISLGSRPIPVLALVPAQPVLALVPVQF